MIYYNSNIINDWNFGDDNIIKVYKHGAVVFYKFDSEQGGYKVCYAVVDDITQYSETEFEDVYDKATEKWYKLNNLSQYEQYGIYGSGRNVTTYEGKLTIDDGYEYEWNGSSWVNLGEVSGSSRLPVGYTEVEYIRQNSNYNAYINTGVILFDNTSNTYTVTTKLASEFHSNLGCATIISCERVNSPYDGLGYRYKCSSTVNQLEFFGGHPNYTSSVVDNGDGTRTVTFQSSGNSSFTTDVPLSYMAAFSSTTYGANASWRHSDSTIYSSTIVKNGITVRDFVPAKRDSDSVYGLYDLINDVFYTSPNGNNFIGGSETGTTEYPKYYSEKSAPLDNLTFNTMAEAQAYAEANCVYDGMHATIDGVRYYFDSTDENGWVEDTSYTIWLDPSGTNALFNIGHYWGENYKMVITTYLSGSYSGDFGSFWQVNGHSPIELSFYSNGFYYDMHNPTSTTAPNVRTTDYDFRILTQNIFNSYQNSQVMEITLTYGSFKAELADSGTLIYSSGSTKTGYSWYSGLYQANIGLNNANAKCHLSHIQIYNGNNELVNDFKFIKNNGVVGSQEISVYDSVTNTTYNNTNSNTPVYHIET